MRHHWPPSTDAQRVPAAHPAPQLATQVPPVQVTRPLAVCSSMQVPLRHWASDRHAWPTARCSARQVPPVEQVQPIPQSAVAWQAGRQTPRSASQAKPVGQSAVAAHVGTHHGPAGSGVHSWPLSQARSGQARMHIPSVVLPASRHVPEAQALSAEHAVPTRSWAGQSDPAGSVHPASSTSATASPPFMPSPRPRNPAPS